MRFSGRRHADDLGVPLPVLVAGPLQRIVRDRHAAEKAHAGVGDVVEEKLQTMAQLWGQQKISLEPCNALKTDAATTLNEKLSDQAKSVVDSVKTPSAPRWRSSRP